MAPITADMEGCWVDGANGIYMSERIQEIANEYGWNQPVIGCNGMHSEYDETEEDDIEAAEQAEQYMNTLAPDGYWFGHHPDWGDWGLYKMDDDDEV